MKVRALKSFAGNGFNFHGGETKEVSKELGELLIRDGLATAAGEAKEPAKVSKSKTAAKK